MFSKLYDMEKSHDRHVPKRGPMYSKLYLEYSVMCHFISRQNLLAKLLLLARALSCQFCESHVSSIIILLFYPF